MKVLAIDFTKSTCLTLVKSVCINKMNISKCSLSCDKRERKKEKHDVKFTNESFQNLLNIEMKAALLFIVFIAIYGLHIYLRVFKLGWDFVGFGETRKSNAEKG